MLSEIRGFRNNNPGNIRHGPRWVGLRLNQTDTAFCQFESPEFGIRALARILITYYTKYQLRTIRQLINRYAPPSENKTESYIRSVCLRVALTADQDITMGIYAHLNPLCKAIIHHELGHQPYSDYLIDQAIVWAQQGVPIPLMKTLRDRKGRQP